MAIFNGNKKFFNHFYISYRTDGRESPMLTESDADHNSDKPKVKYGELVILGWVCINLQLY